MHVCDKIAVGLLLIGFSGAVFASDLAVLRNGFSIRHERRETVGPVTRLFTTQDNAGYVDIATEQIDHFEKDLTPPPALRTPRLAQAPPQGLDQVVNLISNRHHLDPDLVNSVIRAESGFHTRALSPKGAQGLMQLMPQTASQLGVIDPFEPNANVEGGTRYLRELLERYNFDLIKALAAYNAGPYRVEQYHGVPPYYETRAYVARIVRDFNRKKLASQKSDAAQKTAAPKKPQVHLPATLKQAAVGPGRQSALAPQSSQSTAAKDTK
jgi:soluble lytic murein transglycosylase-like protein